MTWKVRKPGAKLLGIGTFLLFFILKEAFPKPAYAFLSSLDACATKPECAAAISSEVAPAVSAPTGAGFGTSTLTTTTATGASSSVNAVAGITVVGDMRLSSVAAFYIWNQAQNTRAQKRAKDNYCILYPNDPVCGVRQVTFYSPNNRAWLTYRIPQHLVSYKISDCYCTSTVYCGKAFLATRPGGTPPTNPCGGPGIDLSTLKDERTGDVPWFDWSQEKRSTAVAALKDSDWQGLITSMPVGGRLNPGDKINAPTIVIPGQETDDSNTPADERILRKEPGFFTNPGGPDTDFDKDGTPDSADPEPQNPNVPTASSNPPSNDTPSEGEQAVDQVRESYDDFLDNPENASYRDRLDAIEEKYRQAAAMEEEAATDPDAGYEQDRLIGEADTEFRQLENEIGEAWWSSLSQYEQQLFDGRTQTEINEMQTRMKQWDKGTFDDVAHSIVHHAPKKGYEDPLEYMRDASRFDKSQAARIPSDPNQLRDDGTVRWVIRDTGEYRIETPDGKTLTYGFDQY